ncbi:autotransporter outer membrane beta-barrel domain-containing protein, partial [Cedecea sp. NFIX57]|uniref:autotransporter outer membrane beta-barrel domain-containing protein n=1 Tax=Cedecea sp. NFIX57 TaxID=1566286 RepID=UPI000A0A621D
TDKTTRSTDALLGALSSGLFISDGEMQSVRSRRGDLQNGSQDEGGVWGRYLNNNTHVHAAGTAAYRLEQNGMELGGDKILNVGNDRLALGLFGNYSKNNLKQDRGNSSSVDSWGTGVYATWFGAQGYYVDGVVKYNHFSTNVRSQTETGRSVTGNFDQNGLGASLETGYRFTLPAAMFVEPYVRASYFTADGKDVKLSNGLEAKADRLQSIRGEAGVSAGKRFDLNGGVTVSPYVTVAVEQEFDKDNNVRMNDAYNFNNDFSGTTGRYGLGVTSQLTHNASVYLEANYRKGEHVESPVTGNAGFRVSF